MVFREMHISPFMFLILGCLIFIKAMLDGITTLNFDCLLEGKQHVTTSFITHMMFAFTRSRVRCFESEKFHVMKCWEEKVQHF